MRVFIRKLLVGYCDPGRLCHVRLTHVPLMLCRGLTFGFPLFVQFEQSMAVVCPPLPRRRFLFNQQVW